MPEMAPNAFLFKGCAGLAVEFYVLFGLEGQKMTNRKLVSPEVKMDFLVKKTQMHSEHDTSFNLVGG